MKQARIAALAGVFALLAAAQQQKRASPHETVSTTLDGGKVTITYGRPYAKGRKIMGGLVPYGKVWRTGADEATKLTTDVALMIGDVRVPAGSYSLFTIPEPSKWTLVINKTADQFGAFDYDQKMDFGRTAMKVSPTAAPVEQFTIKFSPKGGSAAALEMVWENTLASVPVTVAK
jgi:hypothetical protein